MRNRRFNRLTFVLLAVTFNMSQVSAEDRPKFLVLELDIDFTNGRDVLQEVHNAKNKREFHAIAGALHVRPEAVGEKRSEAIAEAQLGRYSCTTRRGLGRTGAASLSIVSADWYWSSAAVAFAQGLPNPAPKDSSQFGSRSSVRESQSQPGRRVLRCGHS